MDRYAKYAVAAVFAAAMMALLAGCGRGSLTMSDASMEPAIPKGEKLTYDRRAYTSVTPVRSEIVVARIDEKLSVGRVVGLQFQKIEVREGEVLINDEPLPEPYVKESGTWSLKAQTIPRGQIVLLGDNRSTESFRLVPLSQLAGKVLDTS